MAGQEDGNLWGELPAINLFLFRDWLRRNYIPSHSAPTSPLAYLTPGPEPTDFNDATAFISLIERKGALSIWRIDGLQMHLLGIDPPPVPPGTYEFSVVDWLYLPYGGDAISTGGLPETDGTQTQYWNWNNFNTQPDGSTMYLCLLAQNSALPVGEVSSGGHDVVLACFNSTDPYTPSNVWAEAFMEFQPDELMIRSEGVPGIADQTGMKAQKAL